jgi:hypothetical protein
MRLASGTIRDPAPLLEPFEVLGTREHDHPDNHDRLRRHAAQIDPTQDAAYIRWVWPMFHRPPGSKRQKIDMTEIGGKK